MKILLAALTGVLIGTTAISVTNVSGKITRDEKNKIVLVQADEYKTYREDQEKKIKENDKKIAELRAKKDQVKKENVSDYEMKINDLEKKNNDLRKRIAVNYKDQSKEKWESFKKEFNHDMDELGKSLKDLFKDNVK
jgi:hypothetical protein